MQYSNPIFSILLVLAGAVLGWFTGGKVARAERQADAATAANAKKDEKTALQ
jgi:threonine/homoserine/homoserine lactone efflux protein